MAIILALMAMLLMSTLGAATVLTTSAETLVAANFQNALEGSYAAEAALELAIADLNTQSDWSAALAGSSGSAFVDGPPRGVRRLADGSPLDLGQVLSMLNCRRTTSCSAADLVANTARRPWGVNNPVWRMFVYGSLATLVPGDRIDSTCYVVVMVADDPSENDSDPLRDGHDRTNPGTGVLVVRAEAFGPRATHQVIEATVGRFGAGPGRIRVLTWRQLRS